MFFLLCSSVLVDSAATNQDAAQETHESASTVPSAPSSPIDTVAAHCAGSSQCVVPNTTTIYYVKIKIFIKIQNQNIFYEN
jgi:hypothetical protein